MGASDLMGRMVMTVLSMPVVSAGGQEGQDPGQSTIDVGPDPREAVELSYEDQHLANNGCASWQSLHPG